MKTALLCILLISSTYAAPHFQYPVKNPKVSSHFGKRWGRMHYGTDFYDRTGTPIYASLFGKVILSTYQKGYGNVIVIKHFLGYRTLYAHLSKRLVKVGDVVYNEDVIGLMGSTGRSTGPHLHFEIMRNGKKLNPIPLLSE